MESDLKTSSRKSLRTACKKTFNETLALTKKNYLIYSRSKLLTFLLLTCPFLICLYLHRVQGIVDDYTASLEDPNPIEISLSDIQKCTGEACMTLRIGLTGGSTDFSSYLVSHISSSSSLKPKEDFEVLQNINYTSFIQYFRTHPNKTSIGLILCTDYLDLPPNDLLSRVNCGDTQGHFYLLLYNFTEVSENLFDSNLPDPVESNVLAVKLAVDNAILSYKSKQLGIQNLIIDAVIQSFPVPPNRFLKGYDAVSMTGPFYFFIPPMFIFGLLISEIVKEKELKLRNGLSVIGVSATAFWVSWFMVALFYSFCITVVQIFSGYFFSFLVFEKTPFIIWFCLFMTYDLTMMLLGFMMSTMINSVRLAYTASFTFLLTGLVLQNFFMSQTLIKLFHISDLPSWVAWVRFLFSFYPPYNFSRVFCSIALKAGSLPNYWTQQWQEGPGYFYSDFVSTRTGRLFSMDYSVPSDLLGIIDTLRDALIFIVLTWYFDNVLANNRGRVRPALFPFTLSYWKCPKNQEIPSSEIELSQIFGTATRSHSFSLYYDGIQLVDICKKYPKSKTEAVKKLNFQISKQECLAIIGHNGAGKTTLLSMMTGLLSPSGGSAYIFGYELNSQISEIQQLIGYCPQFNILWDELTAGEHLELFCKLRNIEPASVKSLITEKLKQVGLTESRDQLTKTFSGGMKRRLSVIISSIGDPKVIFMDEPTTGMDPRTRREVWKLIQKLKRERVILLTTHSMEEAELLCDRVLVMVDGRIKDSGTCLELKNKYGEGYKVEMIDDDPAGLWKKLEENIQGIRFGEINGNSLVVYIQVCDEEIQKFFRLIETVNVKEWGISHCSLEEVFMKVTGKLDSLFD